VIIVMTVTFILLR